MAKLSARGREEWLRMQRTDTVTRNDGTTFAVRAVRAYMSDGHLLERRSFLKPDGTVDFSDGWKDKGRKKSGDWDIPRIKALLIGQGWQVVHP